MAYDHERKAMLLLGGGETIGNGAFATLGDLWEWDGARWSQRMAHSPSNGWAYSVATGWQPSYKTGRPQSLWPPVSKSSFTALRPTSLRRNTPG
jgi:hypothetical protein